MKLQLPVLLRLCGLLGLSPSKVVLIVADLCVVLGVAVATYFVRGLFPLPAFTVEHTLYLHFLVFLVFSPLVAFCFGLYGSLPQPPHVEFRNLVFFASTLYAVILAGLFFSKTGSLHSRFLLLGSWAGTCLLLPAARAWVRGRFCSYPWWGYPLVILSTSEEGRRYWHYFKKNPKQGLRPVTFCSLPSEYEEAADSLEKLAFRHPGAVAMLVGIDARSERLVSIISTYFTRVLIIPKAEPKQKRFILSACDVGGGMGFLVQQRLHDRRRLAVKRALDLFCCVVSSVVVVPFCLLVALAVSIDSRGPAIFRQERIGQGGRRFFVYKFRTMVQNADGVLQECLARDPELQAEWDRDHKLRNDPRITRLGRFLRRTSIDELPQILNVIKGDMSLVGPRPIVDAEVEKYGLSFNDYRKVRPGITGLWQISGRNDTSYDTRVELDFYYINNWSVWLDIWVIFQTVPVVLFGRGAY